MLSRGVVWSGSVLAVLAIAAVGGAYLLYPDFFQPPTRRFRKPSMEPEL